MRGRAGGRLHASVCPRDAIMARFSVYSALESERHARTARGRLNRALGNADDTDACYRFLRCPARRPVSVRVKEAECSFSLDTVRPALW